MGSFEYRVKDKSGQTFQGVVEGDDERSVRARLREQGYFVLEVRPERMKRGWKLNPCHLFVKFVVNPLFGGASPHHLAVFYRQFATMVNAGMTLTEAISSLRTQGGNRRLRRVAEETLPMLQSGGRLSDAFARYPWMFPELHISLIRAGEVGGNIDRMLERLADYMEREVALRQKLRMATLYPKILVLAVIFIPNFPILILQGGKPYLRATLGMLLPMLGALFALWAAYRLLYQIPAFRVGIDLVKICVPKLGKMVRMLSLSRFYRVLSCMWAAGAPLSQGIAHGARVNGNWYIRRRLETAIPLVERGHSLSESLAQTQVLPRMALDMLSTGEKAGNVDTMLDKAAEYTENEAEVSIMQSTVIVGVLLLLAMAAYIGYFVVSYYLGYATQMVQ